MLDDFLSNSQPYNNARPKAFLNWIIVDEEFKKVNSSFHMGAVQVPQISGSMTKQRLVGPANMTVRRNGWLYVYVSNESNQEVYFDDLIINHQRGPAVEMNNYYPFGLEIPGLASKAIGFGTSPENRLKFNGGSELQSKEFNDGSGLDWYATEFRSYDPQLGRWMQIDPKPDMGESPYTGMGNNPVLHNDILGDSVPKALQDRIDALFKGNPDGDQTGALRNSTQEEYNKDPITAAINDIGHFVAEITGLNAVDDASATWADPNASAGDKAWASVNLIMSGGPPGETPAERAQEPNEGLGNKVHGSPEHNAAIDNHIAKLKESPENVNIRKNQQQVDINRNKVGNNRPDIQWDNTGTGMHHITEIDTKASSSQTQTQITNRLTEKQQSAVLEFIILNTKKK